jgi:putative transposase
MRASKFTDAQKAFMTKQGEAGIPEAGICCKTGISQATYFYWKKRYGGLIPSEMRRLQELEDEKAASFVKSACDWGGSHLGSLWAYEGGLVVLSRLGWYALSWALR